MTVAERRTQPTVHWRAFDEEGVGHAFVARGRRPRALCGAVAITEERFDWPVRRRCAACESAR